MNVRALNILLIEDNPTDPNWIANALKKHSSQCTLKHVAKIEEALDTLEKGSFDAVLLGISLFDDRTITSLNLVKQSAPQLPIIVLTTTENSHIGTQLIRRGAQDYLIKGEFEGKDLARSIQYAIERQHNEFRVWQQALMKQMLDRIRNSIDLKAVLQTTANEIQKFLRSDRVLIYRRKADRSEETTVVSQSANRELEPIAGGQFVGAANFTALHSVLSKSTLVDAVEDTQTTSPANPTIVAPQLVRSYLTLPIWLETCVDYVYDDFTLPSIKMSKTCNRDEGLWGMLVAYNSNKTRRWQSWEINFLQRLTTQVTIAISQSQLCCQLQTANQKLQQLAILDGLTEIANRRYFDLILDREWHRMARERQPLSLILCDIDCFKAYNDSYGHQQGDFCLQQVANILQQSIQRPADLAARYGGEEFALILPNTDYRGALFIARKILKCLAQMQLPHRESTVSNFVTLSMGVTSKVPDRNQTSDSAIATADRLLYQAKQSGRNRLVSDSDRVYSQLSF